ncbi:DNA-binding Xre family transcriptional regulator [Pedobacter sp. AK017]|uniref:helix-turn-helix domain-containing protein n=1 Tax=Pedobacter sp. AK017 TaxID=2723073 RepID=UPI00160A2CA5|nr:helix-turn-helix transcriptional regulator [Pedobacter sp. AK017]MBB5441260.1 DNA-binding Xre family transcriptional regulator [Pedobacter sp. AK017]
MAEQYIDKALLGVIREKLWKISNERRITLEDIEDRTGFSYSQVYRIVRGTNNISVSGLVAVCKALEVQPSEIFNFDVVIPKYPSVRKERKG